MSVIRDEIRRSLGHAINRTGYVNARIWTTFWGAHQRFFKQLCMGLKVPAVVAEAKAALDIGQCVVIGLQSTGEASLDQEAMSAKWECTGFVSVCRELLSRFVRAEFPTKKVGATEEDEWSVKAKQMLLEFAAKIKLPDSPLDELIDKLGGADQVAEMTGRRARIVRRWPQSKPVYEQRALQGKDNSLENLNVKERNMFMEGKKLVAIISDAASTGISLHADERAGNRRRRVHITMELPWSADKAVQQLGRSHRSNQSCGPLYKLLTTDLGGERRFAAAVARRLQSLGALTKGDRRAATGADLTEFNFDTPYGRSALKTIYTCICQNRLAPGVELSKLTSSSFETFNQTMKDCLLLMGVVDDTTLVRCARVSDAYLSDVSKFLNRILGLRTDHQNMIFSYFTECMEVIVQNAKREGRYDEGLLDITAASIKMVGQPREVFRNLQRGHGTTNLVELLVDRGMDWDHALTRYENYKAGSSMTGFYVSKRDMFGRKMYILVTPKESSPYLFRVARPSTGVSGFDQEKTDLLHKYTPISIEKAKEGWVRGYELSEKSCMHGSHCKHKGTCTVGKRCYTLHMLCGNIATLMSVLESALVRNAPGLGLSKFESRLRVVRVAVDSGERVVGVRYPEVLIPEVERVLREQKLYDRLSRVQAVLAYKQQAAGAAPRRYMYLREEPAAYAYAVFFKELYTQTTSFQRAHDIAEEKGVGDLEAGSVSPWTQPDAWEQAFVRPEPQLDWTFLCHPDNREKIRANIASRKGVGLGDIDKVVQLWNQHQTAKTAMEKQSLWQELLAEAVQIPNTSHPAAPVGDESQAHVVEIQGDRREFDFTPQTVVELGEALQLLRTDYLAMATGPRTYYFLGDLARLEQALVNFTVHYLRQKGFHLISVPDLLHPDVIESCGFSTQGNRTQVYKLSPEKHGPVCLAGTAEMSLGGFFANQTLDASDLPIKVAAVSRCYRAETSDIAEEKGIYRVHQFTKVEMFGVTSRDESGKLLQELLDIERHLFLSLGLHFRILDMPTEELGAPAHRKFDIETWMPGKGFWGEVGEWDSMCRAQDDHGLDGEQPAEGTN
nr:hypothetical protein BaRGS_023940 [Batillaria attramentaria]